MPTDRFTQARLHALYRILNTPARPWPHRHLFVEEVFPADFYAELQRHMPATAAYTPLAQTGKVAKGDYEMRSGFLLNSEHLSKVEAETATFWTALFEQVLNEEFVSALMSRHREELEDRACRENTPLPPTPGRDMILVRDSSSDGVKIHTSDRRNLLTLLFYLPADDRNADCGTTLYLPKDRTRRCWGGTHHDFAEFDPVHTLPFLPNSLFMFVKTDDSFHGVKPIRAEGLRRDLLLFYAHR